jgi:hypothetical protein
MAKKKAARSEFNMAAETRALLGQNSSLTAREVYDALQKKFPNEKVNKSSCDVSYYTIRRKLGIGKPRRKVRRLKPGSRVQTKSQVDMPALLAARRFIAEVGDQATAIAAIKQVASLQIR